MTPNIIYQSKKKLAPSFGRAYPHLKLVLVRKDLPGPVKKFVLCHEIYHLTDPVKWWLFREIRANWHALWRYPIGAIMCAVMSLSAARLAFYWDRVRKGY